MASDGVVTLSRMSRTSIGQSLIMAHLSEQTFQSLKWRGYEKSSEQTIVQSLLMHGFKKYLEQVTGQSLVMHRYKISLSKLLVGR